MQFQDPFDWHAWRLKGIGSSETPIVMGVSPYKTRYQLWQEKTQKVPRSDEQNWAQRRGNRLEPKARSHYELMYGVDMEPAFFEHKDLPFIRSSLDGFNQDHSRILEIKCPGKKDHDTAKAEMVPEKYYPQIQQQLFVTGAAVCHYYSYDGENDGVLVEVLPDTKYIEKMVKELCDFWKLVQTNEPPALVDKDYAKIKDKEVISNLKKYKRIKDKLAVLNEREKEVKKLITSNLPHPNMVYRKFKVITVNRIGAIDYSTIPELKNVDLEKFRKEGSSYNMIVLPK